jgi:choline dehydrogenase-like flavoprotein
MQVPTGLTRLFKHPLLDWNLKTVQGGESMGNVGSYIARGKLLGGSSSTNATLYHRGTPADYESWGIKGWKPDDVLPWFKCAEDNPAFEESKYHSTGVFWSSSPAILYLIVGGAFEIPTHSALGISISSLVFY